MAAGFPRTGHVVVQDFLLKPEKQFSLIKYSNNEIIHLKSGDGSEHVAGSNHTKLKQVDEVEGKVSEQILLNNILTSDVYEHCQSLGHLTVSHKPSKSQIISGFDEQIFSYVNFWT